VSDLSSALVWEARRSPLAPTACFGRGPVARLLVEKLLTYAPERLALLKGVGAPGLVLVLGETDLLPWVDGLGYLGRDPEAPGLLLPTQRRPDVHLLLVERALKARAPHAAWPLAVLLDPSALVPVGEARPLDRAALEAFLAPSPRPVEGAPT
jgi:hypothetical protein